MNKKVFIVLAILALGALFVVYRIYNKPHKDIAAADVDFELQLSVLIDEFESDSEAAQLKYTDKVIMIEGIFQDFQDGEFAHLFLSDGELGIANCELLKGQNVNENSDNIRVKGLFVGYEDLIEPTIQIKKCTVLD